MQNVRVSYLEKIVRCASSQLRACALANVFSLLHCGNALQAKALKYAPCEALEIFQAPWSVHGAYEQQEVRF